MFACYPYCININIKTNNIRIRYEMNGKCLFHFSFNRKKTPVQLYNRVLQRMCSVESYCVRVRKKSYFRYKSFCLSVFAPFGFQIRLILLGVIQTYEILMKIHVSYYFKKSIPFCCLIKFRKCNISLNKWLFRFHYLKWNIKHKYLSQCFV